MGVEYQDRPSLGVNLREACKGQICNELGEIITFGEINLSNEFTIICDQFNILGFQVSLRGLVKF